jgi:ribose-phosphate pyrophosphokinase
VIVVPGPASTSLGQTIAEKLNAKMVPVNLKQFPDGEYCLRFEGELDGEEVVVVQSTGPPQDTNVLQLLLMLDAAKEMGAKKVTAVVPYLAFARQDKRFLSGEVISAETLVKLIEACGTDRFITVNIHSENTLYGWLKKERDRYTGEIQVEEKSLNVQGRDVIVFDDIISTGGTIARAVKMLKTQGARRVYAACVHPLLIGEATQKILQNGAEEIIGTDSIPTSVRTVSLAPLIAEALAR